MDVHERVLEKLIEGYRAKGLSVDRVLLDPTFKALPVEKRIQMVMKFGNALRSGQKIDSLFLKNLAVGAAGTALMVEPIVSLFAASVANGYFNAEESYGGKVDRPSWVTSKTTVPHMLSVARMGVGGKLMTSDLTKARAMLKARKAVKQNLSGSGDITQDQAINVISATIG